MTDAPEKRQLSTLAISDGTPASEEAIRAAIRLTQANDGKLTILAASENFKVHPEDEPPASTFLLQQGWAELPPGLRHVAMDIFPWLAEGGLCEVPGAFSYKSFPGQRRRIFWNTELPDIRIIVTHLDTLDALTRTLDEEHFDLVVVRGRVHSGSWLKQIFNRDISTVMAAEMPASLLVVKAPVHLDSTFVLCSNSKESSYRTFGIMRLLAQGLKKPVDMLVNAGQDPVELKAWLKRYKLEGIVRVMPADTDDPAKEIMRHIPAEQILVLGDSMQSKSWLTRRLRGGVPVRLVRRAPFSVLISKEMADSSFELKN